ncbi:transcriptional pleiotropic regulator of transition state genes [Evansella caseinilytica]|uniref:Transcriptional pleiotropic regulator of transition state genes n=1 Tax=Evansella caseinilytica TaxID=1503961 RepID=A0A1H3NRG2_9BACI|nr:AbrB/MazE/SpoVT family DNA-binding domain-containing protein [Evansella caseinilytica]SDY91482.1 transcriptional pleiotropic regulator of transition state genes [Evansella caseinilytica]
MKSIGIVRKVDELGRIVIPMELRRTLNINIKDPIEIYVENEKIILKKYQANMACDVTGEITNQNEVFLDGKLVLSPEGKAKLLKALTK